MLKKILIVSTLGLCAFTTNGNDISKKYFTTPHRLSLQIPDARFSSHHHRRRMSTRHSNRFYSSFGVSFFAIYDPHSNDNATGGPAFTITTGINLIQKRTFAITLDAPLSFGGYKRLYALVDLPLMLDLNIGAANRISNTVLGLRVGAGIGASFAEIGNRYHSSIDKPIVGYGWGVRYNVGIVLGSKRLNNKLMLLYTFRSDREPGTGNLIGLGIHLIEL
jgi:hypothetical protein